MSSKSWLSWSRYWWHYNMTRLLIVLGSQAATVVASLMRQWTDRDFSRLLFDERAHPCWCDNVLFDSVQLASYDKSVFQKCIFIDVTAGSFTDALRSSFLTWRILFRLWPTVWDIRIQSGKTSEKINESLMILWKHWRIIMGRNGGSGSSYDKIKESYLIGL